MGYPPVRLGIPSGAERRRCAHLLSVSTPDFSEAVSKRLTAEFADWLGRGMSVVVEPVERIESEPAGKCLIIKALATT